MEHYHPYLNTRLIINKKELFNEDSQYVRYYTTHPACQGPANTPIIQREKQNKTKLRFREPKLLTQDQSNKWLSRESNSVFLLLLPM